jgi:transcriptional regulator with XRE-family HTH domain
LDDFAGRLVAAMKEKRLKNPAVAEALGVHAGTVSKWRSGLQMPDDEQLAKLARFLGKTVIWLRYGDDIVSDGYEPGVGVAPANRVAERLAAVDTASATVIPRHARNLPLSVREYLAEFQLRLVKGGASEDEIDEAMALLRSPDVFSYFKGGKLAEYNEEDVLDGMRSLAEDVVIPRLQKLGRKVK